jgi:hypothetical protein
MLREPLPIWLVEPLAFLGIAYVIFFPLGVHWFFYVATLTVAAVFSAWLWKGNPRRTRLVRLWRNPSPIVQASKAETEAKKAAEERYSVILTELLPQPERCLVCGKTGEELATGHVMEILVYPIVDPRPPGGAAPRGAVFVALTCMNCGNTDFFSIRQLDERINERQEPPDQGEGGNP